MREILVLISILFIVGGFLVLRDRGITARRWLFISVLAILFMMMAAYGSQLVVNAYYPTDRIIRGLEEERTFIDGLALLSFGILGYILLSVFRAKSEDLSFTFGLAGSVLVVVGLIELLWYKEALAKFVVTAVGVIVVSYLIYRYKDFLIGGD
ncbi:MAG: hypothetical protein ACE5J3_01000 [Methanosarcinales archaeon]